MRVARALWLTSLAAGLLAIVTALLEWDAQVDRLSTAAAEIEPGRDTATLDAVATIVFGGSLAALVLVVVIEAVLLKVMMRRHAWARWALLVVLLVHSGVVLLAEASLAAPGIEGILVRLLLLGQLLLAGAGLIVSVLPGARRWFRTEHQSGGHAPG
ncbi:MAG: hypothetical protein JWL94_1589 [Microbacteriaceae bacterium]|jgi:hypothetical protein|nr:hypothetical protein [Microbacteriaceae bacterium]